MVDNSGDVSVGVSMNTVFHALANDARRHILGRLADGDLTIGQLAAPLNMSLAGASKHVQVLERAGLLRRTVRGRLHVCHLEPGPLAGAYAWLRFYERFWTDRLSDLEALFRAHPTPARPTPAQLNGERDSP